jgi:hypothetical protein
VEHVVFFPAPDGTPAFRRLSSLDEAVTFVEHLRNEREVQEVSVHALAEVPLAFRTVYRVEVAPSDVAMVPAPAESADGVEDAPAAPMAAEPSDAALESAEMAEEAAPVGAGNGSSDTRTLGFFAS